MAAAQTRESFRARLARLVATALGHVCAWLGLYPLVMGRNALVLALHRVEQGDASDAMTMTAAEFDSYCRFFAAHFRVARLEDVVDKLRRGESFSGELVITFDDGYRDVSTVAAPILAAHGLTATVFVVSEFMGKQVQPWWDERDGARHPFLSWDEVRALHAAGVSIGSHTMTHPDMGSLSRDQALSELAGSKAAIERELGAPVTLFAYPYGHDEFISDDKRRLAGEAGYHCCCGYGYFLEPGSDPLHLARRPLSDWYRGPAHLGGHLAVLAIRRRLFARPWPPLGSQ